MAVVAASFTGAAASLNPVALVGILGGAVMVVAVVRRPWIAVATVLAVEGFALAFLLAGVDTSLLHYATSALAAIGAVISLSRSRSESAHAAMLATVVGMVVVFGAFASWLSAMPNEQIVAALRLVLTPALCAVIGRSATTEQARAMLKLATVLVVSSALAAVVERRQGIDRLVNLGLEYGTTVRSYDGLLRAPGLFATNYSMGAFAGVVGALALAWWPAVAGNGDRRWRQVALVASAACLILSIYRTGMLVLVFTASVLLFMADRGQKAGERRLLRLAGGSIFVAYVAYSGLLSTESTDDRFLVWSSILRNFETPLTGNGLGFSGSASVSRFAETVIVVDNYYLSLFLQLGVFSLALFLPMGWIAVRMLVRASAQPLLRAGIVVTGCLVAFAFVDFWEYTSAMSLALFAGAAARNLADRTPSMDCGYARVSAPPTGAGSVPS